MGGYSGTPLLKKLGIKEGDRVLLRRPPATLPEELKEYAKARLQDRLDVIILFARSFAEFKREFAAHQGSIKTDGMIWVAWPKKASGMQTDLTENAIRDTALKTPFVDVKVCAIDETWSGLKLVVRKEHRNSFGRELNRN
ncbi:MAG: DUF3052 domain-containing protein [Terracidiphilus sp.]|nr:DUF3052 domain-containing protein [Terracidiphilus sp.]MDR3796864.1 DUF3052 domain-containing protein [Terracidiphilus sp.]